jgi:hypothetical protein
VVGEEEEPPPPEKPPPRVEEKGGPPGDLPQEPGQGQASHPQGKGQGGKAGIGHLQEGHGPIMAVN